MLLEWKNGRHLRFADKGVPVKQRRHQHRGIVVHLERHCGASCDERFLHFARLHHRRHLVQADVQAAEKLRRPYNVLRRRVFSYVPCINTLATEGNQETVKKSAKECREQRNLHPRRSNSRHRSLPETAFNNRGQRVVAAPNESSDWYAWNQLVRASPVHSAAAHDVRHSSFSK